MRKEDSHERRVPETPKDKCRRCNKISWSTVSSAALTSKRAKSVSWQRSTAPRWSESSYRNIRNELMNEYHFPIVCGRWDNGGLLLCTNSCMYATMYVYISVYVCWCACMYVCTSVE